MSHARISKAKEELEEVLERMFPGQDMTDLVDALDDLIDAKCDDTVDRVQGTGEWSPDY